jgi:hypothetical protein
MLLGSAVNKGEKRKGQGFTQPRPDRPGDACGRARPMGIMRKAGKVR